MDRPGFDSAGDRARLPGGGDEQYRPGAVTTTYRLTDAAGRVLLRHTAAAGQVTSRVLFSAELQPGGYRLTLTVGGSAKRRVGLSVAGPVEISASSIASRRPPPSSRRPGVRPWNLCCLASRPGSSSAGGSACRNWIRCGRGSWLAGSDAAVNRALMSPEGLGALGQLL